MDLSNRAASAAADAVTRLLDGGWLRIYDQASVELAACQFSLPAFEPAQDGLAHAAPIGSARAKASGTPTRFRAVDARGRDVLSGSVGLERSGADLILASALIVAGAEVLLLSMTYRQPTRR